MRAQFWHGSVFFLLMLTTSLVSFAQVDTARLQGTVTDPQGAAAVGATVLITSVETGRANSTTTNDLGFYSASALPPGRYRLEITQPGFKKISRELELQIAQVGVADFRLDVGDVTQTVTVEAGSPVINPADSTIGDVVESRQITELPLNGRNFTELATLIPGVTRGNPTGSATGSGNNTETFRFGQAGGASLAVNGLRPQNNNFTLDGIDNNETLVNTIVFFPPADAIDEFRVETSVPPAEIGRAGGAVVATSLKSGKNDFHGSAFIFNRDQIFDAKDFFNSGKQPGFHRNQFGGTFGGPVIKNKLFFFVDYEGLRQKQPLGSAVNTVPTDAMRNGDFSELLNANCATGLVPGGTCSSSPNATVSILVQDPATGLQFMGTGSQPNVIPGTLINTVGQNYLNAFPEPNCTPQIDSRCTTIINNYINTQERVENWNDFDVRADYLFNDKNTFFVRVSRAQADQTQTPSIATLPSGFGSGSNFNHPWGAAIGWTDILNQSLVNTMHFGFVRTSYGFTPPFNSTPICTNLGIPNCNTPLLGGIALIGGFNTQISFTGDFGPFLVPQTSPNFSDSISWNKGHHAVKFGTNIIRRELNLFRPLAGKGFFNLSGNGTNPVITGYEVSDLLAGFVATYSVGPPFGMVGTRSWEDGFFAQDDWRVTPRLTLNLGIRYDIMTWPTEVEDRQANFDITTGALIVAGSNGAPRTLLPNDYHDFGPRLGFAYQLTADGKTVVRGGYGLFYFLDRGGISNQLAQNPPFSGEGSFGFFNGFRIALSGAALMCPTTGVCPDEAVQATGPLPLPFTSLNLSAPTNISPIAWLPSNRVPQVSQYNLQVQRQLGTNQSLSLAYVGTYGSRLTRNYNANQQLFNLDPSDPTSRLFANLGSVTVSDNRGKSIYNSLQAQYERRFTNGLQFLGAFTWSKTIDDSCGALDTCAPQLYTNYNIERGLSEIDQPYRMSLSALYELPFGRGRRWGSNWSRPIDWAVGGWQLNGIYTLSGGMPFSVTVNGTPGSTRADLVSSPSVNPGNISNYINAGSFALPPTITFTDSTVFTRPGTSGRNILLGPGLSNIDLSLFKNFAITEKIKTELRLQAYNATNTPHFGQPNSNFSNGNFGQITTTLPFTYRQVELGLRVTF
jgi:hypothetical protein